MQIESTRPLPPHVAGGLHEASIDIQNLRCYDAYYCQMMGIHVTTGCGRILLEVSGIQAVIVLVLPR